MNSETYTTEKAGELCAHDWVYKILHDHTGTDVCTKCDEIKPQTSSREEILKILDDENACRIYTMDALDLLLARENSLRAELSQGEKILSLQKEQAILLSGILKQLVDNVDENQTLTINKGDAVYSAIANVANKF